jgi:hypothetical protein
MAWDGSQSSLPLSERPPPWDLQYRSPRQLRSSCWRRPQWVRGDTTTGNTLTSINSRIARRVARIGAAIQSAPSYCARGSAASPPAAMRHRAFPRGSPVPDRDCRYSEHERRSSRPLVCVWPYPPFLRKPLRHTNHRSPRVTGVPARRASLAALAEHRPSARMGNVLPDAQPERP